jgi:phage baseplate assembly protein W
MATSLDRFGTGLARPFRRAAGRFATATGYEKVMQSVEQVLGTPIGRLPWRASFGCRLFRLRHMANTVYRQELARVDVQDALQRWEPRCRVRAVTLSAPSENSRSLLDVEVLVEIDGKVTVVKRTI